MMNQYAAMVMITAAIHGTVTRTVTAVVMSALFPATNIVAVHCRNTQK